MFYSRQTEQSSTNHAVFTPRKISVKSRNFKSMNFITLVVVFVLVLLLVLLVFLGCVRSLSRSGVLGGLLSSVRLLGRSFLSSVRLLF